MLEDEFSVVHSGRKVQPEVSTTTGHTLILYTARGKPGESSRSGYVRPHRAGSRIAIAIRIQRGDGHDDWKSHSTTYGANEPRKKRNMEAHSDECVVAKGSHGRGQTRSKSHKAF